MPEKLGIVVNTLKTSPMPGALPKRGEGGGAREPLDLTDTLRRRKVNAE